VILGIFGAAAFAVAQPDRVYTWLVPEEFLDPAYGRRQSGSPRLSVLVAPNGLPVRCAITIPSANPYIDTEMCRQVRRRARFTPAHGPNGEPIFAVWSGNLTLEVVGAAAAAAVPAFDRVLTVNHLPSGPAHPTTHLAELFGSDGKVEACNVIGSSGSAQLDDLACQSAIAPLPLVDTAGHPVSAVVEQTLIFTTQSDTTP